MTSVVLQREEKRRKEKQRKEKKKKEKKPLMLILTTLRCVFFYFLFLPPSLPWWECRGEQMWTCWTLRRLFGFIQVTHTQACAEVSESWLWSSGLRRLFILQPSEALKPRSDVSRLSAPVWPRSQFHNTNSSPESISYQLYIYFFHTNLFSQLASLNFPSDPSALPSVRHSVFLPLVVLHPTHPRADFGFFLFPQP